MPVDRISDRPPPTPTDGDAHPVDSGPREPSLEETVASIFANANLEPTTDSEVASDFNFAARFASEFRDYLAQCGFVIPLSSTTPALERIESTLDRRLGILRSPSPDGNAGCEILGSYVLPSFMTEFPSALRITEREVMEIISMVRDHLNSDPIRRLMAKTGIERIFIDAVIDETRPASIRVLKNRVSLKLHFPCMREYTTEGRSRTIRHELYHVAVDCNFPRVEAAFDKFIEIVEQTAPEFSEEGIPEGYNHLTLYVIAHQLGDTSFVTNDIAERRFDEAMPVNDFGAVIGLVYYVEFLLGNVYALRSIGKEDAALVEEEHLARFVQERISNPAAAKRVIKRGKALAQRLYDLVTIKTPDGVTTLRMSFPEKELAEVIRGIRDVALSLAEDFPTLTFGGPPTHRGSGSGSRRRPTHSARALGSRSRGRTPRMGYRAPRRSLQRL